MDTSEMSQAVTPEIVKLSQVTVDVGAIRRDLAKQQRKPNWPVIRNALGRNIRYNSAADPDARPPAQPLLWWCFIDDVKEASRLECSDDELLQAKRRTWGAGFPGAIADALGLRNDDALRAALMSTAPTERRGMKPVRTVPESRGGFIGHGGSGSER